MTIIDHSKVMEHCGHHLVVTLCLPQGDFELDFHFLIGHLFADEETQPDNHVVETLLGPDDFLELRVLKKGLSSVHQPLRSAFQMIKGEMMHQEINAGPKLLADCDLPRIVALVPSKFTLH